IHCVILRAYRPGGDGALGFLSRLQSLPDCRDPAGRDETRAGRNGGERSGARGGPARPPARRAGMGIRGKIDGEKIALYLPEPDGNQNSQSGPPPCGPQSCQVVADAPRYAAAEFDFVPVARIALLAQRSDRLAELSNV